MMRATCVGELLGVARRREREVADVEVEVEVGVGDPVGAVEAERDLDHPPPERLDEVQPALELGEERAIGLEVGVGRPLVDREAGDVAEASVGLHVEEPGVQPTELLDGHGP